MPKISALPVITSPDSADELPIVDTSTSSTKKMTLTKLKEWLQSLVGWVNTAAIADANVTTSKIADAAVTPAKLAISVTDEVVGSFTYKVYDYGTYKVYKADITRTNVTATTEYGPFGYPSGIIPEGRSGTRNAFADFSIRSTSGGYPNLHTVAFSTQTAGWFFYATSAASTNVVLSVTFTTF